MIREYLGRRLGAALLSLLLSCLFTKEELQKHAGLAKKREEFKIWQQPELRETSPSALFEADPKNVDIREERVEFNDKDPNTLWGCLEGSQRRMLIKEAERNQKWNMRRLAKFNARIPLDPSVEKISERTFINIGTVSKSKCLGLQRWNRYRRDHHKACGGSNLPVPRKPFRFLELPFELRQEVYKLVLSRKRQVFQFPPDGSATTVSGPVDVRIFAVSRAVYEEAVPVFYQCNAFAIDVDNLPLFVQKSTGNISPRPAALIRKVHIGLILGRKSPSPPWNHIAHHYTIENSLTKRLNWAQLWSMLESCRRLMSVAITAYIPPSEKATYVVLTSCAEIGIIDKGLRTARSNADLGCANEARIQVGRHDEWDWKEGSIRGIMGATWEHTPPITLANRFWYRG